MLNHIIYLYYSVHQDHLWCILCCVYTVHSFVCTFSVPYSMSLCLWSDCVCAAVCLHMKVFSQVLIKCGFLYTWLICNIGISLPPACLCNDLEDGKQEINLEWPNSSLEYVSKLGHPLSLLQSNIMRHPRASAQHASLEPSRPRDREYYDARAAHGMYITCARIIILL